jgi:hypothetical protein
MVLRAKPRNRRSDFETQITKPELPVLRPKLENPPPPWFWGSNKKPTIGFEVKPGETVTISFETKLKKNRRHWFWGQTSENRPSDFEAKPLTNRRHRFWGQNGENRPSGFEAKPLTNRWPWFWGSTKKLAILVSMC